METIFYMCGIAAIILALIAFVVIIIANILL